MSEENLPEPESWVVVYDDQGLRTTPLMSKNAAHERAALMNAVANITVLSVMPEEKAREYIVQAQSKTLEESFFAEPTAEQIAAFEEAMEEDLTARQDDEGADAGKPRTDLGHEEYRIQGIRHQALDWALRLMEARSQFVTGVVAREKLDAPTAQHVVDNARVFERYLKGPARRTPKS